MVKNRGFTYLTALFVVAIIAGGLALVGEHWQSSSMRDKEAELLFAGDQYRRAIQRYVLSGMGQYPPSLDDLIKDPRRPATERHLRRLYLDPMTGKDWGVVKAPSGGVLGVYSLSEERPFKTAGFKPRDRAFEGAQKYSDWKFVYTPPAQPAAKPATK
jgi:type II secretory pathway pseudopilin PulG